MVLNQFSKNFMPEALEFILKNNNFKFDEVFYNQTEGTAMGTKSGPSICMLSSRLKRGNQIISDCVTKVFLN